MTVNPAANAAIAKLVLRPVTWSDIPSVAAIEQVCFVPGEAASIEMLRRRAALYPEGFLVAELDGHILGFVNGGATHEDDMSRAALKQLIGHDPAGPNLAVFGVAVHPDWQGKGVSRPMLEAYIVQARRLGKAQVMLLCKQHLTAYYQKFGFVDAGKSASNHGGASWHEMRLKL